jgi:alpha-L-fucosidase 2
MKMFVCAALAATAVHAGSPETTLWYGEPATRFYQSLPLGNGRIGAMVFGGVDEERIVLNESSVWSGSPEDNDRKSAHAVLPEIRRLLLEGKNVEAEALVNQTFTCAGQGSGHGNGANVPFGCYQVLGNLRLKFGETPGDALSGWSWRDAASERDAIRLAQSDAPEGWLATALEGGVLDIPSNRWKLFRAKFQSLENETKGWSVDFGGLDDTSVVFVNGREIGRTSPADWNEAHRISCGGAVMAGTNVLTFAVSNIGGPGRMAADVHVSREEAASAYRRGLDLASAVARVSYERGGARFGREHFVSAPDQVFVTRLTADKPGAVSFEATLDRPERFRTTSSGPREILMSGALNDGRGGTGVTYVARLRALAKGGTIVSTNGTLRVEDADEVVLLLAAATDYKGVASRGIRDPLAATIADLDRAAAKKFEDLAKAHVADHQRYFNRVSLRLSDRSDGSDPSDQALPTNHRLVRFAKGEPDPALAALYFNYGRYLLIGSSRPGGLPANLQGIWAEEVQTPWNGDWHLDINVQMNYWPAPVCNLSDLQQPLNALIASLAEPGQKTAKEYYNARGWVTHVITNPWGFTSPGENASWGATTSGSAWLCQHLWTHYAYTLDEKFLREAYPILKGCAEFYLDLLIEEPKHGWLVTAPANSPENAFVLPDGRAAHVCLAPTIDMQLLRELFANTARAAEILGLDDDLRKELVAKRARLAPNQIGPDGRLQEWLEPYKEREPHHRHCSHLYGLHPGYDITREGTPELAAAVRKSLEGRGDGANGWSLAWKINFWARLGEGDRAHKLLAALLRPTGESGLNYTGAGAGSYANLFDACPPFQIDGNFGGCAGIAEMLLQSHPDRNEPGAPPVIRLLPALPSAWPSGEVRGLRARGAVTADISWRDGTLADARLTPDADGEIVVRWGGVTKTVSGKAGRTLVLNKASFER